MTEQSINAQHDREMRRLDYIRENSLFYSANSVPRNFRKLSGQLRANCRMGINAPDLKVFKVANYRPNAITGELAERARTYRSVAKRVRDWDVVFMTNDIEYGPTIHFQKGDLAYSKAIQAFPRHVARAQREARNI